MRNYQRKRNNSYQLPHNVYMQILYAVRDYERMKQEYKELCPTAGGASCQGARETTDPDAEDRMLRLQNIELKLRAIDRAMTQIPEEYRHGIWKNIIQSDPYPISADSSTWSRWRQRFLFFAAKFTHVA